MVAVEGLLRDEPVSAGHFETLWSGLTQDFYHATIVPLLLLTVILAWLARPSTSEVQPAGFRQFQMVYLTAWAFCVAADWLQGPYVYALYDAYGFSSQDIAKLFVAGFGSSLVFGCAVGSVSDRFGRKACCLAYCVLYIISCCTKHFNEYHILMFGRITGGIATSMLFSCFECWMVSEHCSRMHFSSGLLSYMFGLMYSLMYFVAIGSGLCAQAVVDAVPMRALSSGSMVHVGGMTLPFDMAIVCLVIGGTIIMASWKENYGSESIGGGSSLMESLTDSAKVMTTDVRIVLLCVVVSCFEGGMYSFVFNWTPALESDKIPPPFGVIFALFMMACMCGASAATLMGDRIKPLPRLLVVFATSAGTFVAASRVSGGTAPTEHLMVCFVSFLVFEFCCGVYFPSIGVLKSEVVPERIRGTMYNIYRVPLNGLVVLLLLTELKMTRVFGLCALCMCTAALSVGAIAFARKSADEDIAFAKNV